jgi:hypothetical protein
MVSSCDCVNFQKFLVIHAEGWDYYDFDMNEDDPWYKQASEGAMWLLLKIGNLWNDAESYYIKWYFGDTKLIND